MPVKTHGVAYAARKNLESGTVRIHPVDGAVLFGRPADVAWDSDWNVKHAVGTERNELPSVMGVARKLVGHKSGRRWSLEVGLDIVVSRHARHFSHIQRTIPESQAGWHIETLGNRDHLIGSIVFITIDNGIDISGIHRANEERAVGTQRHLTRFINSGCINADAKARRKLYFLRLGGGLGCAAGNGTRHDQKSQHAADVSNHN